MKMHLSRPLTAFVLLISLLALAGCAPAPKWLTGKWQGTGDQIDGQQWQVVLDATDLRNILINYPSLSCGGTWRVESKSSKEVVLRETLKYGIDKCDQNVEVHAYRPEDGKMRIEYFIRSISNDPLAKATLSLDQ